MRASTSFGRLGFGFTIIELLVVMTVIALLLTIAAPRYLQSVDRAREATLRENLYVMRDAIDKHYADTGRYPDTLQDLVVKRYLRNVPLDPVTGMADSWTLIAPQPPEPGRIYDVKSGSTSTAIDGTAFSAW